MLNQIKSVLYNSSAGSDVQYAGGFMTIPGLPEPIKLTRIVDFSQINYRAEVVQVVTVGATSYAPEGSKRYGVYIYDTARRVNGGQEVPKLYAYTTPATITDIGANAQLQREFIHGKIVTAINAFGGNYAVAASLGTGSGFTITDDAGYYPYNRQGMTNRLGANTVKIAANDDGYTGFAANNIVLTTAAVYSVGVGADLANQAPVYDLVTGHLISGNIDPQAPKTVAGALAVSGQRYNMFSVTYTASIPIPTIAIGKGTGSLEKNVQVWVDNGAGTSTANLAGYLAFSREMQRGVFKTYSNDPSSQVDFLDGVITFQGAAGAVPTTTGANKMTSDDMATWIYTQIGTQTLTTPTPSNTGLILDQDLTDTEGAEYTPALFTNCPKQFVVGKVDFSVYARITAADWTDAAWLIGFRRKAAHTADFNDYTDLAAVGTLAANGDLVTTQGILNNAATVSTSTGIVPTDAATLMVEVLVNKAGLVTCRLNDVVYPVYSAGTTALILDAGDIMIPFVRYANISTGDPDLVLNQISAVAGVWKY